MLDRPRADDDRHVRDAERDVGDDIWPIEPRPPKSWAKNSSRLRPMMISGVDHRQRGSASPPAPRAAEAQPGEAEPEQRARGSSTRRPRRRRPGASRQRVEHSSFANSIGYQSSVNPVHVKLPFDALNANMIRMTIGANRKA